MPDLESTPQWELRSQGSLDQLIEILGALRYYRGRFASLPQPYDLTDVGHFAPSTAIYFMDGLSSATVRLLGSAELVTFSFKDRATSVSASAPFLYDEDQVRNGRYLAAPPPLSPVAYLPSGLPDTYRRRTTLHLLQVVSMNMWDETSGARLLIGLPYAENYPELFFRSDLFEGGARDAASYGVVSSLTDFVDPWTGRKEADSNGYPARSCFAVLHILQTKAGTFFNKKPTVMELQPDAQGKLARKLPPIPFTYTLINGPIPLFDVKKPNGPPIAQIDGATHRGDYEAKIPSPEAWPWHLPNLKKIHAAAPSSRNVATSKSEG